MIASLELLKAPTGESLEFSMEGKTMFVTTGKGLKFPVINDIICFLDNVPLEGNNLKYQKMYNRIAAFYDIAGQLYAFFRQGSVKKRIMNYLSLLEIKDSDKVMEISIGTGRNIRYLKAGPDYFGVDISLGMLNRCLKQMKKIGRDISLIQAEAEALPLKDNTFDVVFSAGGFNFFNDPGKAMLEMIRIAKAGTIILITDETETFRLKHSRNEFYKNIPIKDPRIYLPSFCTEVEYREICDNDLYVLTFRKP